MGPRLLAAAVMLATSLACVSSAGTGAPPCDALISAGLRHRLLLPTDDGYEDRILTWMSRTSRLHPWCLLLPETTAEVSSAMAALSNAGNGAGDWHIAIRSGGVSALGSNNIANGVTIDMSMMNSTRYNAASNVAILQPGARWSATYADLEAEGVVVVGGRDGSVGVGGFFLGGGTSYFTGTKGFGCDSVVNYEVVLGNGTIINANSSSNSDLWRALKGGGNNFGIVTRFDVEALPTRKLAYDLRYLFLSHYDTVVSTIADFAAYNQSMGESALIVLHMYRASMGNDSAIGVIHINTAGDLDAQTSFNSIKQLPSLVNVTSLQSMAELASAPGLAMDGWSAGITLTFTSDPAILHHVAQVHERYISSLKTTIGAENFMSVSILQPIPLHYGQIGLKTGGNVLGLEDLKHPAVMWDGGVVVTSDAAAFAVAQTGLHAMMAEIKAFAESVGGLVDLVYLNYAAANQDPLGSYGAERVRFLREVAAKYDPEGVFQMRIPGGFKLTRVRGE
ncbi:FAD binding domain-containing protein [Plectosphaerella plurivora]|uniref:FAD binding domain-containing protein n=1 Tax=Plectosphaerella plurivora TaxID=936078 RepID=A0A9P8VI93_9PEZI|nr:FAD binding domain-containing protein [Plectosphaerella plurivora]